MRFLILSVLIGFLFVFPFGADAAQLVPVQCSDPNNCGTCEFVQLVNNVIQFIVAIVSFVAIGLFIYAGILMVTSVGNSDAAVKAKNYFKKAVIGYVLILAAFSAADLLLAMALPDNSPTLGWRTVQCIYPNRAVEDAVDRVASSTARFGGGGSCDALSAGPCSPEQLEEYFPGRADEASRMCNKESGGAPILSGSDRCCGPGGDCSGAPSFSGGLFQVNIISEARRIPGCSGTFFAKNGNDSPQGNCVKRNAEGICTGWSCTITNQAQYRACMQGAVDSKTNLSITKDLFASRGFQPWANSANRCGIPTK